MHTTVLGVGERSGNAPMEDVVLKSGFFRMNAVDPDLCFRGGCERLRCVVLDFGFTG